MLPKEAVNFLVEISDIIVTYLSVKQYQQLDVSLLNAECVKKIFPGFEISSMFPGYTYTIKNHVHIFQIKEPGNSSYYSYSQKELDQMIKENRGKCEVMAKCFLPKQLQIMKPKMAPEVQKLVDTFLL